jgi:hypothetical protein
VALWLFQKAKPHLIEMGLSIYALTMAACLIMWVTGHSEIAGLAAAIGIVLPIALTFLLGLVAIF